MRALKAQQNVVETDGIGDDGGHGEVSLREKSQ
jgi:hypothetical protein